MPGLDWIKQKQSNVFIKYFHNTYVQLFWGHNYANMYESLGNDHAYISNTRPYHLMSQVKCYAQYVYIKTMSMKSQQH